MTGFGKTSSVFAFCLLLSGSAAAQTEFPKEFIAHLKLSTGLVSGPSVAEYFVGSLQIVPQFTIVPFRLRGGIVAGGFYSARRVQGLFGPTLSYKLTEFQGGYFGSVGNLHLNLDHLWGTKQQRLLGGGVNLDLLNKLLIGLSVYRDYHLKNWWVASAIGFRISAPKKEKQSFPN